MLAVITKTLLLFSFSVSIFWQFFQLIWANIGCVICKWKYPPTRLTLIRSYTIYVLYMLIQIPSLSDDVTMPSSVPNWPVRMALGRVRQPPAFLEMAGPHCVKPAFQKKSWAWLGWPTVLWFLTLTLIHRQHFYRLRLGLIHVTSGILTFEIFHHLVRNFTFRSNTFNRAIMERPNKCTTVKYTNTRTRT